MQQISKQRIIFVILILIITITGSVQAGGNDIKDMNFKGADIRDVLRAVSEVAGVNIVTDGSVKGNITIHLKSISFQKALDLITQSHGLDYKWDDNTVVVATPNRIKEIYEKQNIKLLVLKNNDLQRIKSIVNGIYPELNIQIDNKNEQLILVGGENIIKEALTLIEDVKYPEIEQEKEKESKEIKDTVMITEIVTIKYSNPEIILRNIKDIYSGLKLSSNLENKQIIMHGEEELIKKAVKLVNRLDLKTEKETEKEKNENEENGKENKVVSRIIKVKTNNLDSMINNINNIFPELKVSKNEDNKQIVIRGLESEVIKAEKIINNLDSEPEDNKEEIEKKNEITENISIKNGNLQSIKEEILNVIPELKIKIDNINEQLIISGFEKEKIEKARTLAQKWDSKQLSATEIVRVDYVNIENVKSIVANLHPEVSLNINKGVREIIIRGKAEEVNKVVTLIDTLDVSRRQVIIEARVEEVSSSKLQEIGVNPENFSNIHFIKDSSNQITDIELTWPDFLDAMKKEGASETLARPRLITLNGEKAKMLIGQRIPVKMENSKGETSIKYIEAGITLEFEPWITKNNEIELNIQPKVSSLGEELYAGYPSIKTREIETNLRLKDGETFAIGGLIQEDESESMSEVPVLSEIPILGEIFRHNDIEKKRTELLIFITPRIVSDKLVGEMSKKEVDKNNEIEENKNEDSKKKVSKEVKKKETADPELESKSDIMTGNEVEKIINYSRRKRIYDSIDGLPANLNIFYRVSEGETVADIAKLYGISANSIKEINNLDNEPEKDDLITLGIPHDQLYRIKWGETLYQLANKYNIELVRLRKINSINIETNIPGNFIIIFPKAI